MVAGDAQHLRTGEDVQGRGAYRASGCLRREYLANKEKVAPLHLNRGDLVFFVYGQRLSSLFRSYIVVGVWLIIPYLPSLFLKYSNSEISERTMS